MVDLLRGLGLSPSSVVADVGSGTGIFTRLLLEEGCRVLAVEPNRRMRECAERLLGGEPGFESVAGSGEATGLPPASVDLITVAQAFHWLAPPGRGRSLRGFSVPAAVPSSSGTTGGPTRRLSSAPTRSCSSAAAPTTGR